MWRLHIWVRSQNQQRYKTLWVTHLLAKAPVQQKSSVRCCQTFSNFLLLFDIHLSRLVNWDLLFLIRFDFCHFKNIGEQWIAPSAAPTTEFNFASHHAFVFPRKNNTNSSAPVNCHRPSFPYMAQWSSQKQGRRMEEWNDEPLRDGSRLSRRELSAIHQCLGDILAACFASCPPPSCWWAAKTGCMKCTSLLLLLSRWNTYVPVHFWAGGTSSTFIFTCMNWYMSNSCPPGHSHNRRHRFPWRRVRANCTGWCIRTVDLTSVFSRVYRHFWRLSRLVPLYLDLLFPGCLTSTFLHLWIVEREIISNVCGCIFFILWCIKRKNCCTNKIKNVIFFYWSRTLMCVNFIHIVNILYILYIVWGKCRWV